MRENNCSFCSVLMKLSNIWNGFVPVLKRSSCHLGNLTDTLFSLSKYAELQRMNNTPYYLSLWGWIAWDHHDCVRGSLQELEKRILNFSMVHCERNWRRDQKILVLLLREVSFLSVLLSIFMPCGVADGALFSPGQLPTPGGGSAWIDLCLDLPIEGRLSLQLFQKV